MGYRSEVVIMLESKAYEMVMDSMKKFNEKEENVKNGYSMKPHDEYSDNNGNRIIRWYDVKWYPSYDDVKSVENVLSELNSREGNELEGYRYKELILGEDNATEEYTNDYDWSLGYDFLISCSFDFPAGFNSVEIK